MKKNLLFINGNLGVGGVEMALVNLLSSIDTTCYDIDLLLLQDGYDYVGELPESINCIKINIDEAQGRLLTAIFKSIKKRNWISVSYRILECFVRKFTPKFYKFIYLGNKLRRRYDAVISFRPGICADIALHAINSDIKICWWHHGNLSINIPHNTIHEQLSHFDRVVAVSPGVKNLLDDSFSKISGRINVIPNIINISNITRKAQEYNPYKELPNSIRIVSVSRLSPEKNVNLAVDIARILKERGVKFTWHIIGDGICRIPIEKSIKQNNLESFLYLEGSQVNPYPWIVGADLMVHPSSVESFAIAILEAMALGIPCVAVESIGSKYLINGKNGLLKPNNADEVAEGVIQLINDSNLRKQVSLEATEYAQSFGRDAITKFSKIIE